MASISVCRSKAGRFIKKGEFLRREIKKKKTQTEENSVPFIPQKCGRRIVDLDVMSKALWCTVCNLPLSLGNRYSEVRSGLSSNFTVPCTYCKKVYTVSTSQVRVGLSTAEDKTCKSGGRPLHDVNFKAAIGIIDAGIGAQQLNSILSALNIPNITESLLKRHERKVGLSIESVAKETCLKMTMIEKELSSSNPISSGSSIDDRSIVDSFFERDFFSYAAITSSTPDSNKIVRKSCIVDRPTCPLISPSVMTSTPTAAHTSTPDSAESPSVITLAPKSTTTLAESASVRTSVISSAPTSKPVAAESPSVITLAPKSTTTQAESASVRTSVILSAPTFETVPAESPVDGDVQIATTYDAGWQMRGNGRSYNSQSGHGAIMGFHTRKVLDFATRCRICRKCNNNIPQDQHDCRRNFMGSAKAMEPDMAVQLVLKSEILKKAGVTVSVLVGDDDSSTMAAVRRSGATEISKWSDVTHCKKNVGNALYKLQPQHRVLTSKVIKYIQKCFMYAITQNKNNPNEVKYAILNVTDHIFGKHEHCGKWCRFILKPFPLSRYCSLPRGECLTGLELENSIRAIFVKYSSHSEKLAPCASTQANEALNSSIASKNPKSKFYSGSESNDFRVAAAVSQVNMGGQYVLSVNEKLGLSPGENTKLYKCKMDRKRKMTKARQSTGSWKRRRLVLSGRKSNAAYRNEMREGISYQSGMALMESVMPVIDLPVCDLSLYKLCYFDLETSGLSPTTSEVVQIAALVEDEEYSCYIQPRAIPTIVTDVTGLHITNGKLHLNSDVVETVSKELAWRGLIEFCLQFKVPIILVGHNISFDVRFTFQELKSLTLEANFLGMVHGVVDTLQVLKKTIPGRANYKQDDIALELSASDSTYSSHNAIGDVRTLRNILMKLNITEDLVRMHYQSFASQNLKKKMILTKKQNRKTLLLFKDVISKVMISKIAAANLNLTDLQRVFSLSGGEGIRQLFTENCSGKPRVTKNEKVLSPVIKVLQDAVVTQ